MKEVLRLKQSNYHTIVVCAFCALSEKYLPTQILAYIIFFSVNIQLIQHYLLKTIFLITANTVDRYNDRFMSLGKGLIDLQKFIELDKNN